jgi:hypothetical protein
LLLIVSRALFLVIAAFLSLTLMRIDTAAGWEIEDQRRRLFNVCSRASSRFNIACAIRVPFPTRAARRFFGIIKMSVEIF